MQHRVLLLLDEGSPRVAPLPWRANYRDTERRRRRVNACRNSVLPCDGVRTRLRVEACHVAVGNMSLAGNVAPSVDVEGGNDASRERTRSLSCNPFSQHLGALVK
eukprot:CAMPEP_0206132218 /NCGR_PEP_ID=MMETSP1472-20131121/48448_1 /ASSEMBLY_ACC=CAM_ASM_001108 /TAXON_ID=41880 /ORGANISM="Pycnococcus provasolii, Strain RCC251" /LENGTH=104 /DNA_ID=CAMNT_0053523709 /DNA_START=200 /DNA_END=514 /DNA_ORIENTATION=-